jgi:hypothetical protein
MFLIARLAQLVGSPAWGVVLMLGFAPILACPAEHAEALKCLSG